MFPPKQYLIPFIALSVLILGALTLAACQATAAEPTPIVAPAGAQAGELSGLQSCAYPFDRSKTIYEAECSTLVVPENWDADGSRLMGLPVVRIPATGPNPEEPVFWFEGGPGGTNFSYEPPAWLLKNHDVVIVGYRGVDGSVVLSCPEIGSAMKPHVGKDLWAPESRQQYVAATYECAERHQAAGVDISGYTIPDTIEDMEAARRAFGYERINLLSVSYGTRVAQVYAFMYPESIKRSVLFSVNTPGHFLYDVQVQDELLRRISDLCAADAACSTRTSDLARTMYDVNRNMPKRWLFFTIDPDSVRLGANFMMFTTPNMGMIVDAYLAAGKGDYSGLAMINLATRMIFPVEQLVWGEYFSVGGTSDLPRYRGLESISLGDSIIGAPFSEMVWPMAEKWPIELIPKNLRELQESSVEMLLVNGTIDLATPPIALDEARPYFQNAQFVLLSDMAHGGDITDLQPEAWERLLTSYLDTGVGDASLYEYYAPQLQPKVSLVTAAKALVAIIILVPSLLILGILLTIRAVRRRRAGWRVGAGEVA